jgi:hypothetical protein
VQLEINKNMGEIRAGARSTRIILLFRGRAQRSNGRDLRVLSFCLYVYSHQAVCQIDKKGALCNEARLVYLHSHKHTQSACGGSCFFPIPRGTKEELNSIFGRFIAAAAAGLNSLYFRRCDVPLFC